MAIRISRAKLETLVSGFLVTTMLLFAIRDSMSGVVRYTLSLVGAGGLWFIVDGFAFGATIILIVQQFLIRRNPVGIAMLLFLGISLVISMFTTNDTVGGVLSSIKMILPMLSGFALAGYVIEERRWAFNVLKFVFVASVLGLLLNPYINYPWVGETFSTFGVERQATRLWWVEGGVVRYGGLAGDNTMAGYFSVFLYIVLSRHYNFLINALTWPVVFSALYVSTSKTAMGVFVIAVALYLLQYVSGNEARKLLIFRFLARVSFLFILVPVVLIIFASGMDLTEISNKLFSLQDRINNTWQEPYALMFEMFPWTIFTGCGLGCMTYPLYYTSNARLFIPLDNFYLATLLMMGPPFLLLIYAWFKGIKYSSDITKLNLIFVFNIYSITVQCYGPSFATLMIGYMFSDIFALRARTELRLKPIMKRFGSSDSFNQLRPIGRPAE